MSKLTWNELWVRSKPYAVLGVFIGALIFVLDYYRGQYSGMEANWTQFIFCLDVIIGIGILRLGGIAIEDLQAEIRDGIEFTD